MTDSRVERRDRARLPCCDSYLTLYDTDAAAGLAGREHHVAVDLREQRVVRADADVDPGGSVPRCRTRMDPAVTNSPPKALYAQASGVGITAVAGATPTLLVRHEKPPIRSCRPRAASRSCGDLVLCLKPRLGLNLKTINGGPCFLTNIL